MQRDTLIRYLLDELNLYEDGHSDALRPIQRGADSSFMGEHRENEPVTIGELRGLMAGVEAKITVALSGPHHGAAYSSNQPVLAPPTEPRAGEHAGPAPHLLRFRITNLKGPKPHLTEIGMQPANSLPSNLAVPRRMEVAAGERWLAYVRDWEEADPAAGLQVALKDWDEKWYSGISRGGFAMLRRSRQLVAEEFINK